MWQFFLFCWLLFSALFWVTLARWRMGKRQHHATTASMPGNIPALFFFIGCVSFVFMAYTVSQAATTTFNRLTDSSNVITHQTTTTHTTTSKDDVLAKAEIYAGDGFYMSKNAIFQQMTSKAGDNMPADQVQAAIDQLKVDYNKNAVESAKMYTKNSPLSEQGLLIDLTSPTFGAFTDDQAAYAVAHANIDFNANALKKAQQLQHDFKYSADDIRNSLKNVYSFNDEEINYALNRLH